MKLKPLPKLKKDLDAAFSKYIRLKYADDNGNVACYTCGVVKHWKDMHCGHFISRRHLATRWDECNCKPQCVGCNLYNQGNSPKFAVNLMKEYGGGIVRALVELSGSLLKINRAEYVDMIDEYTRKLRELENK